MSARGHRQAGFALAESIAVLALSALVLLTLLIATDLVSRNSASAARRANDLETLATGLAAIRRDLEGTLFIQSSGEPESPPIFSGDQDSVGVAVASDGTGRGHGESLLRIETRYEDGEGALIRSSAPLLPHVRGFADVQFRDSALVAVGPWRYRFSYASDSGGTLEWATAWSSSNRLPAAIRLEVLDGAGDRVVPALTVRLHVTTGGCPEGGCGGDPFTLQDLLEGRVAPSQQQ
ncbi:MAG: hypothetical protein ACRED5_21215 [Propylenella sp.]